MTGKMLSFMKKVALGKMTLQDSCALVIKSNINLRTAGKGFADATEVPSQLTLKYADYLGGPDQIR